MHNLGVEFLKMFGKNYDLIVFMSKTALDSQVVNRLAFNIVGRVDDNNKSCIGMKINSSDLSFDINPNSFSFSFSERSVFQNNSFETGMVQVRGENPGKKPHKLGTSPRETIKTMFDFDVIQGDVQGLGRPKFDGRMKYFLKN